ncbi:MAG: sulfatase [Acidobacteriota bacterium]
MKPLRQGACRLLAAALLALFGTACQEPPDQSLIILCIDTLRADHVGVYGYDRDTTPNLDRMSRAGAVFDDVIAQSNWTVPATASILTSLYPSQHGAGLRGDVRHLGQERPLPMAGEVQNLGEILSAAGLRTALLSANPYLYGPFKEGFDLAQVGRTDATSLTDRAIEWLRIAPDKPHFLYLQYIDLHQPLEPPEPYFDYFEVPYTSVRGDQHVNWGYPRQEDLDNRAFRSYKAHKIALYDGALRYVDAEIGRLLAALEELGLDDSTLVMVTSDHGEEFWDHAEIGRQLGGDPRDIWGIGHGHSMFRELLQVPWILTGSGIQEGQRIPCPARQLDIAPTALALLGLEIPTEMQGVALDPHLRAANPVDCTPLPQIAESPAYGPDSQSVTWKGRKLIRRFDGVELLYDLRQDAAERSPLTPSQDLPIAGLQALIDRELAEPTAAPEGEPAAYDAETEAQLRALGYL